MVIIMPFKNKELSKCNFKNRIKEESILNNLLKILKLDKNNVEIEDIIEYLTWIASAS